VSLLLLTIYIQVGVASSINHLKKKNRQKNKKNKKK